jgi:nucleotide-binding universal stress UspA family protein
VLTGQPEGAIERCVDEYDIQLVVIGCRPKRGFVQFLHGRNGYRIMTHVRRSLHVVYFDDKAEPVSKPASRAA